MADQTQAFVVPEGLLIEQDDHGLSIEHEGDIVLHGTLGQRLRRVHSRGGSVTLHLDTELEELAAPRGDVTVHGSLRTGTVRGRRVSVDGALHADGVYGGAVRIDGDVDAGVISAQDGGVHISGSARVGSEIESDGGDVIIAGTVRAGAITAQAGRIDVTGAVTATEVRGGAEVQLRGGVVARTVEALGELTLSGVKIDVERAFAETLRIRADHARVKAAQARESIDVGPGHIEGEVFIAPNVQLDPATSGRVTGIEALNEAGVSRVRGGLRLDELAFFVGDMEAFLAERGLHRLDHPDAGRAPERSDDDAPAVAPEPSTELRAHAEEPGESPTLVPEPAAALDGAGDEAQAEDTDAPDSFGDRSPGDGLGLAEVRSEAIAAGALAAAGLSGVTGAYEEAPGVAAPEWLDEPDSASAPLSTDEAPDDPGEDAPVVQADLGADVAAYDDAAEQAEREAQRLEAEREAQRLEAEQAEREAQRLEAEQAEREEQQRLEAEQAEREAQRLEAERLEAEQAEREEQQRLEAEQAEREAQRLEAEQAEREAQRLEAEQAEREEQQRLEAEQAEREEQQRLEAEQAEREAQRLEAEQAEREEQQRLEAEQAERERVELERAARVQAELEQAAREQAELEQAELEQAARAEADRERDAAMAAQVPPAAPRPAVADVSEDLFDLDSNALGPDDADPATAQANQVADITEETAALRPPDDDEHETAGPSAVAVSDARGTQASQQDDLDIEEVEASRPNAHVLEEPSGLMLREDVEAARTAVQPAAQPEAATPVQAVVVEEDDDDEAVAEPAQAAQAPSPSPEQRPAPAPAPLPPEAINDPIYMLMLETVGRMTSCYTEAEMPPAVQRLRQMVERQDYDGIRSGFSTMWNDLVAYHRDRGLQLQPRVSHTFRTIDTIVRNL